MQSRMLVACLKLVSDSGVRTQSNLQAIGLCVAPACHCNTRSVVFPSAVSVLQAVQTLETPSETTPVQHDLKDGPAVQQPSVQESTPEKKVQDIVAKRTSFVASAMSESAPSSVCRFVLQRLSEVIVQAAP